MRRVLILLVVAGSLPPSVRAQTADRESLYYADAYADHYGVPRALVHAIVTQESGWNPLAVSATGAQGLGQLMPGTAARYGVRQPFARSPNLSGCVRYLRDLLIRFHGDMRLAVAGYYAGEDRIAGRGLAFSNPDVVAYVEQVRRRYQRELNRLAASERTRSR